MAPAITLEQTRQMLSQTFGYRGKELIKPLSELIKWLEESNAKLDLELIAIPIAKTRHAIGPISPDQRKQNEIRSRLSTCAMDMRTAKDWLRECLRTPRAVWALDFHDLRWLYQYQNNV